MTKQTRRPGFGFYFLMLSLLIFGFYTISDQFGPETVTYAEVETLFESEQVVSFFVQDGDILYLNLKKWIHSEKRTGKHRAVSR